MSGKIVGIVILAAALIAGAALYYLQVYGFYREVPDATVRLVALDSQEPEEIDVRNLRAIDADSSPIRFRACFETDLTLAEARETFAPITPPDPRNAPGWFECFDAPAIADEIEAGRAETFLGVKNIHYGVDRIVALTGDGRGYVWHELNDCGEKSYDGTVIGEACPERPAN